MHANCSSLFQSVKHVEHLLNYSSRNGIKIRKFLLKRRLRKATYNNGSLAWREGLAVEITCHSCRGSKFSSQYRSSGYSQVPVTSAPRSLRLSSLLLCIPSYVRTHTHIHAHAPANTHTNTKLKCLKPVILKLSSFKILFTSIQNLSNKTSDYMACIFLCLL